MLLLGRRLLHVGTSTESGFLLSTAKIACEGGLDCVLVFNDTGDVRMLLADGVSDKVKRLETVHVSKVAIERRDLVVLGMDFAQIGQLLNTAK